MERKQYSIGVFASMNKVSTRMLRHYDKIGLLRPASILPNGYRCYSEEQITVISQIKRLRDCDFLLEGVTDEDITDAHIDGIARFLDDNTILTVSRTDFAKLYEIIAELYQTREIVPILVNDLFQYGGMLHCVTQQQPHSLLR